MQSNRPTKLFKPNCHSISAFHNDAQTFFSVFPRDVNNEVDKYIRSHFSNPEVTLRCKIFTVGNNPHYVCSVPPCFSRKGYDPNEQPYSTSSNTIDSSSVDYNYSNEQCVYTFFGYYNNVGGMNDVTIRYLRTSNALMICIDLNRDDCEQILTLWANRWANRIGEFVSKKNFPISVLLFNSEMCDPAKINHVNTICEKIGSLNEINIKCYKIDLTKSDSCELAMADLTNATLFTQASVGPASLAASATTTASVSPASAVVSTSVSPASAATPVSTSGMFGHLSPSSSSSTTPSAPGPDQCTLI